MSEFWNPATVGAAIGVVVALLYMLSGRRKPLLLNSDVAAPDTPNFDVDKFRQHVESQLELSAKIEADLPNASPLELAEIERQFVASRESIRLLLRQVKETQSRLRSTHAQSVRRQGPMFRGGGGVGKVVRFAQTVERSNRRSRLADELQPYQQAQHLAEDLRNSIDLLLARVKALRRNSE